MYKRYQSRLYIKRAKRNWVTQSIVSMNPAIKRSVHLLNITGNKSNIPIGSITENKGNIPIGSFSENRGNIPISSISSAATYNVGPITKTGVVPGVFNEVVPGLIGTNGLIGENGKNGLLPGPLPGPLPVTTSIPTSTTLNTDESLSLKSFSTTGTYTAITTEEQKNAALEKAKAEAAIIMLRRNSVLPKIVMLPIDGFYITGENSSNSLDAVSNGESK
jgi:hypothetical protein